MKIGFSNATPRPWIQFLDRDKQTIEFLPAGRPGTTGVVVSIATAEGEANAALIDLAVRRLVTSLRQCEHCGVSFEVGPGSGRRLDAKFCCDEHRVRFNSAKRSSP